MRHNAYQLRKRALRVAFAVSWVSSMQMTGCLNNSARTDLAGEPGKAALLAEHEQELGKRSLPGTATLEKPKDSKVVSAGGATPDTDSAILRTGGETPAAKKSLWSTWTSKPSAPAIQDPFADAPELKPTEPARETAAKATLPPAANTAAKSRLSPSAFEVQKSDARESNTYSPENWFEKEFSKQAKTTSWEKEAIASSNAAAAAADKQTTAAVKLGSKSSAKPAATPADAAFAAAAQKNLPEQKPAASQQAVWASVFETSNSAGEEEAAGNKLVPTAGQMPAASTDSPSDLNRNRVTLGTSIETKPVDSLAVRQQKLRIQALLSEAHTSSQRGELHAAYRSALLAEKIASEHGITFSEAEENPRDYAKVIASAIWRTTNTTSEALLADTGTTGTAPTAAAAAQAAPSVAAADPAATETHQGWKTTPEIPARKPDFPADSFAMWKPLPSNIDDPVTARNPQANLATTPKTLEANAQPAGKLPLAGADVMPEIRPWSNDKSARPAIEPRALSSSVAVPSQLPLSMPADPIDATPSITGSPKTNVKKGADSGVQFAIAHTTDPDMTLEGSPSSSEVGSGTLSEILSSGKSTSDMAAATLNRHRPLLMAPPAPIEEKKSRIEQSLAWNETASVPAEQEVANSAKQSQANFKWRITWSILGLIGAAAAAYIGIRISRTEFLMAISDQAAAANEAQKLANLQDPPTIEIAAQKQPAVEEQAMQPLPFKRAA